jgi:tetratricopeptide (TPR) repeat protein
MIRACSFVIISVALVLTVPASAQAGDGARTKPSLPPEKDVWIQIDTAHFTIYSNTSERRALELGRSLERFRAVLSAFQTTLRMDPPQPNFIYIFKNQESFNAYNIRFGGKLAEIDGLFHPGWDANYIIMSAAWNRDPRPLIYHEFTHQFVESNLSAAPAWFNEGLAEYYSTFVGDDKRAALGKPVPEHVEWLSYHSFIPLKQFFEQSYNPDFFTEVTRGGTFYAQSWALVHYFLANGAERRTQAGYFLDGINQGLSPEAALQASLHTSLDALQQACQAYVAGGRFNYSEVTFTDKFHVDDRATVRSMSRAESLARLGELLQHLQEERLPDAEAHLREALRLEPDNGVALMNMATLMASKGEFEQAVALYKRAAASRHEDPLLFYREARALLHRKEGERSVGDHDGETISDGTLAQARELLNRAIKIRPNFAEAYIELGNLSNLPGGDLKGGIEALVKARTLMPSRLDVSTNLFFLYLESDNRAAAQALFDKVIVPQKDEGAIRWARMRLEYHERIHQAPSADANDKPAGNDLAGTPDEALFEQRKRSHIEVLEKALKDADPESRKRLEEEIERVRAQVNFPAQVDSFNQSVKLANAGDYPGARAILEKLLPQVQDAELHRRVEGMLADLKKRTVK